MKQVYFAEVIPETGMIQNIFDEAYLVYNSIPHAHMVRGEVEVPAPPLADELLEREARVVNNQLRIEWVRKLQPLHQLFMLVKRPFASPELAQRLKVRCAAFVQEQFQLLAQQYDYTSFELLASYANSRNATWSAQARYALDLRDAVWDAFYPLMDTFMKDAQRWPDNEAALLAQLPAITWDQMK